MLNKSAVADSRFARTGKDGALYDGAGKLLASVDTFTAQETFNNAQYAPLGCPVELESPNTVSVTLAITNAIVESDDFAKMINEYNKTGVMPTLTFQGVLAGDNKTQERWVYKNCIPSGQFDIQNITVGDVIKRQLNFHCNDLPKMTKLLTKD